MDTITIPKLYCPFPPAINPHVHTAAKHTDEWALRFDLCHTEALSREYEAARASWMAARFFPAAGLEQMKGISDVCAMLFLVDDQLDHQLEKSSLIRKKETLQQFIEDMTAVMQGSKTVSTGEGSPELAAITELWPRLERHSPPGWIAYFTESIIKLFRAAVWEFENVDNAQLPTVDKYLEKRQYLGGTHVTTDMIPFAAGTFLPDEVLNHTVVQRLTELCHNVICWSNDLFSLSKELEQGDGHNLVCVVQHERRLSLEDAILQAAEIHDMHMKEFIMISQRLPAFDTAIDHSLQRYVQALIWQIRGNIDWSEQDTHRYSFAYL